MSELAAEVVGIDELREDPANVRHHGLRNIDAIAASLERFGQRRPLVVRQDGTVIAGNGTLRAARILGWTRLAITRVPASWSDTEARAYAIADNRTGELAEWSADALGEQLRELEAAGFEAASLGFDELGGAGAKPPVPERARRSLATLPEPPGEPVTKPGDLWLLGEHRLVCGDAFEAEVLDRLVGDEQVAMVATDPPYAIYGSSTGIGEDIADDRMVRPFFEAIFRIALARLPWFGHAYLSCDWRSWAAIWESARRAGIACRNMLVWDKGGAGLGSNYANTHELIGYFVKLPPPTAMGDRPAGQRSVHRPNVLRHDRPRGTQRQHNAAKPVDLYAELIANSSDEGDVVADLFCGSGTTILAAEQLGRRCFAVEVEPRWCDVSIARWEKATGGSARRA